MGDVTFDWRGTRVVVRTGWYATPPLQPAVWLEGSDGSMVAKASVYMDGWTPAEGEVYIKTWSENEDLLPALVAAGVVDDTGRTVPAGYADASVCVLKLPLPPRPDGG